MAIETQVPGTDTTGRSATASRVLVVDDERSMRELLSIVLRRDGYDVVVAADGRAAVDILARERVDVLITDIRMPELTGVDVLREAKRIDPAIISIVMTAFASTDTAVDALRLGAADYVHKSPNAVHDLRLRVRKELERKRLQQENVLLKRALRTPHKFGHIVGSSHAMMAVFELIETIAPTSSTVLITGESGTGKELAARAIHLGSARSDRPFVAVNCGALPDTLLDSELFGHMRGAFTGADTTKKGLLEVVEKGTIFLDEIGEMSPMVQVKLLRVLQERKFRRLGGTEEVEADIRIITATNRDLAKMVAAGDFREDLFYRINVIPVKLPPLRERQDDIQALAEHFAEKFAAVMKKELHGISGAALAHLRNYAWPGNVRELDNAKERAVALERTPAILPDSLPEPVRAAAGTPAVAAAATAAAAEDLTLTGGFDLEQHVQGIEREYIMEALRRSNGVKKNAAELLGLSFRQFRYLLKKYNIQ
jgi:two-component system response regulator PilR (NtrC family)